AVVGAGALLGGPRHVAEVGGLAWEGGGGGGGFSGVGKVGRPFGAWGGPGGLGGGGPLGAVHHPRREQGKRRPEAHVTREHDQRQSVGMPSGRCQTIGSGNGGLLLTRRR